MQPLKRLIVPMVLSAMVFWVAGCVSMAEPVTEKPEAAPAAAETAPAESRPGTAVEPKPPAPQLSVEQIQARRELETALDQDVEEYLKRVASRNVDSALEFVEPSRREKVQKELWAFLSNYSVENCEVLEREVSHEGTPGARVVVQLTVFEKRSVVPQRQRVEQRWSRVDDRWLLLSSQ